MDTLTIPEGLKVTFEPYAMFSNEELACIRIEVQVAPSTFGEVAYWYEDGTNDIMRGEKGTLLEAAQALIDFTHKGVLQTNADISYILNKK